MPYKVLDSPRANQAPYAPEGALQGEAQRVANDCRSEGGGGGGWGGGGACELVPLEALSTRSTQAELQAKPPLSSRPWSTPSNTSQSRARPRHGRGEQQFTATGHARVRLPGG